MKKFVPLFISFIGLFLISCTGQTNLKKDSPEGIILKAATRNVAKYVSLNNPEIIPEGKAMAEAIKNEDDVEAAAALARVGLGYLTDETAHVSKADIRDGIALIIAYFGTKIDPETIKGMENIDKEQLLEALHIAAVGALEGFTEAEMLRNENV